MAADRTRHRRQPRQRGAVADVHQQHQPHTRLGRLHAGQRPFLLHAVRGTWLAPIRRGWIGTGVHPAYGNKNYATGEKQATFVIGYKGMLKLLENSGIYAQPRAVYEDDNIKLKLDENGVPTIECPDEVNVDADHSEDKLKFVYLSVQLPNGGRYADYMSKRDLLEYREKYAPRNRSRQITGPWLKNFVEMAKKTIIRRSFKYLPVNIEAKKAASVDETTPDYSDVFQPVITDSTDDVTAEVMDTDTEADSEAKDE
jgi:recombination protein RecT